MVRSLVRLASTVSIFTFLMAAGAAAQAPVTASGTVRDISGAALTEATVDVVVNDRVSGTAVSGADGRYQVDVPSGVPFSLRVRRDGFADQAIAFSGVSGDVTRDIVMPIGGLSDTLVVSASRGVADRAATTQSVSVATRAEIEALGSTQLSDVLRFVPGMSVEGTGREGGGPTSLFVRGGDSDYNVVLIDGVRANLDGGRFDFSRIAAGEIERVEVVRGAQSSLWGADAMTSVVQIFTRRAAAADAPQLAGSAEAGSFGTFRGNAGVYGGAGGRADYRASVTRRTTDGAFADILPEDDAFRQTTFDGGAGMALGTRATVRAGLRYSNAEGRSVGPVTYGSRDTGSPYDGEDLSLYGTVSHAVGSRFTGTATLNYYRHDGLSADRVSDPPFPTYAVLSGTPEARFPNGTRLVRLIDEAAFDRLSAAGALPAPGQFLASATSYDFTYESPLHFRRPSVRYQGDFAWGAGHRLSAGYDWERERNPDVDGFNLDNSGFFVQQQSTFADRWFTTVGLRVDSKESYSTFVSPRFSAGGFLVPLRRGALSSVKVSGNIGRGVKSPTFTERFGGAGFADPNPDIEVESVRAADLGIEATFNDQRFRASVTWFNNRFTDQISYRPGMAGDGIPEYINIDGSRANGWEAEVVVQKPVLGLTAAATYALVDTAVVTNQGTSQQFQPGQPLLRRPKHAGSVRAAYAHGPVTAHANLRIVGDRFDNSFLFFQTVPNAERPESVGTDITVNPGYTVATLGLDVRVSRALTLYVRGDNIGDTSYDSALGYPGLPRAVVAGARFTLGSRR